MAATKRFHVTTFGCQMNEHDSERMKGMLESLGYAEAPQRDEADLILFNTCSIREAADSRFVAHLHQAKGVKRARPDVVIGVGGCWAQSVKDDVFRQFPFVDVAFGPGQVHKLAEFLTSDSLTAQGYFEFEGFTGHLPAKRAREFQAWVQISVGCNCRCSYCIVPVHARARGLAAVRRARRRRSRAQVADGVREVTLLGQNVNSYGRDLRPERRSFAELLHALDAIDGHRPPPLHEPAPQGHARGRHPRPRRARLASASTSTCRCSRARAPILKAMRRTYDRERYLDRVALIREHVPDCAITTDIIVGFPGETEDGLRADARGLRGGRLRRRLHLRLLAAARDRGGDDHRGPRARTRSRSSGWSASSRSSSAARTSARSASSGARSTCSSRARRAPTPSRLRGRSRHSKTVNFSGLAAPGEIVPVEIHSATSTTLAGEESLLSRAAA